MDALAQIAKTVAPAAVRDTGEDPPTDLEVTDSREPDTRYDVILGNFRAQQKVDPWSPATPTLIARRFDEDREIPEERVRGHWAGFKFRMKLASKKPGMIFYLYDFNQISHRRLSAENKPFFPEHLFEFIIKFISMAMTLRYGLSK